MISGNSTLIRAINNDTQAKEIYGIVKNIQQNTSVFVDISFNHLPRVHLGEGDLLAKQTLRDLSVSNPLVGFSVFNPLVGMRNFDPLVGLTSSAEAF